MSTTPSTRLGREQGLSALCAAGCAVLAVAIPAAVVAFWTFGSWEALALVRLIPPDILPDMRPDVEPWQRVAGGLICLAPALLVSFGLNRVRRSLEAFARGDFFGAAVPCGLRDYAAAAFWAAVASLVGGPVLSVVITLANAPGHRELSADLSGAQVLNLLGAGILWVVASAMARAADVARENAEFI